MTDRENLIELLKDMQTEGNKSSYVEWAGCKMKHEVKNEQIADHLIANGVTVQKWIPVTERLPEKGGRYLALTPGYLKGFDQYDAWLIYYHPESDFYDTDPKWGDIPMDDVTHWMPLPQPPKEG